MTDETSKNLGAAHEGVKGPFIIKCDENEIKLFLSTLPISILDLINPPKVGDCNNIFNNWIYNGIVQDQKQVVTLEMIRDLPDETFDEIISSFVREDQRWEYLYHNENLSSDKRSRFVLSFITLSTENIYDAIKSLKETANNIVASIAESCGKMLNIFSQQLKECSPSFESFFETFRTISDYAKETIQAIHIPTITEERKQELLKSYEMWGSFGWTTHPCASLSFYNECPDNYKEADKIALSLCGKESTNILFELLKASQIPKNDLMDAIFCFEKRRYKPCAMLLYALIDRKMIKWQKKSKRENLRPCGKKAIGYLKEKFIEKPNIEDTVFLLLDYSCLIKCLEVFFEDAKNFSLSTNLANRNLVDHGMAKKQVRRKDCLKLFLLLYNITTFIDDIMEAA